MDTHVFLWFAAEKVEFRLEDSQVHTLAERGLSLHTFVLIAHLLSLSDLMKNQAVV